ncbi:MAG: hypothetical protein HYT40_03180 [Candidatus Sungbacteria bacterium]|uniref:CARDB domain-containing protein n=1 Tax=Candidatus Sungiibacteriota bacterium TaxID=2750080 RepID=A0A931WP96_9BACT|nr:hypothetical protein [Candidatus Sungbacteria bacterium]
MMIQAKKSLQSILVIFVLTFAYQAFAQTSSAIIVLSPNGGEIWSMGSVQTIKWTTTNYPADTPVSIVLLEKDENIGGVFKTVQIIAEATTNDGSENFLVPAFIQQGSNDQYFVQVGGVSPILYPQYKYPYGWIPDKSDSPFSIVPASTVAPTADLVISGLKVQPTTPTINQRISISFDVENRGISDAGNVDLRQFASYGIDPSTTPIGIIANLTSDGCKSTAVLEPQTACHVEMTGLYNSAGPKILSISADPFNKINEVDESNNKSSVDIVVVRPIGGTTTGTPTPTPASPSAPMPTPAPAGQSIIPGEAEQGLPSIEPPPSVRLEAVPQIIESQKKEGKLNIDAVETVELKQTEKNQPTYEVRARKRGRLLFLIPVTMQVTININAENGAIEAVKKPWWSLLMW